MSTSTESAVEKLSGKIIAAGPRSARKIGYLLGLNPRITDYHLSAIGWVNLAVFAELELGGNRQLVLKIEPARDDSKGIIVADHLAVSYTGGQMPKPLAQHLSKAGVQGLRGVTLPDLAEILVADPELGKPGLKIPAMDHRNSIPHSFMNNWGGANTFADFYAANELGRGMLDSLGFESMFVFVQHGDHECNQLNPFGIAPIAWLVNFPWQDRLRTGRRAKVQSMFGRLDEIVLCADQDENDVIMGNTEKLDTLLAESSRLAKEQNREVFFANTCTPIVTGEDVESNVRRLGASSACSVHYLTVNQRSMVNAFHEATVRRRMEAEKGWKPPGRNRINLFGLADTRDGEEVLEMIRALGIEINALIVPDLKDERLASIGDADLNVYIPNDLWQHIFDQLMFESPIPKIVRTGPQGIEGTRVFLQAIVKALGMDLDFDARWEDLLRPHTEALEAARAEAARHRLGIVARAQETHYFTKPSALWGVPLVPMLEEMGYGLDFLVMMRDRNEGRTAAQAIQSVLSNPDRHEVKGFHNLDLMFKRLEEATCDAVFTFHQFDWRVTAAGKNMFSLQHFEQGVAGAIRSARRINEICRTPFFQRYRRYLGRTQHGLRFPPEATSSAAEGTEPAAAAAAPVP